MPAAIDGKWYIHYIGQYSWSHFEAPALKSAEEISANGSANNLVIYPNPVQVDNFNIEIIGNENNTVDIYSLQGKLVFSKKLNSNKENIVTCLTSGLYILKVNEQTQMLVIE
jgi:hypothetical protein